MTTFCSVKIKAPEHRAAMPLSDRLFGICSVPQALTSAIATVYCKADTADEGCCIRCEEDDRPGNFGDGSAAAQWRHLFDFVDVVRVSVGRPCPYHLIRSVARVHCVYPNIVRAPFDRELATELI